MLKSNEPRCCLAASPAAVYRRNVVVKAPRKRHFLVQVQCRSSLSAGEAEVGGGSNGPRGPRDIAMRCWGNDNNSGGGEGGASTTASPWLLTAVGMLAVGMAVSMPNAATAAFFNTEEECCAPGSSIRTMLGAGDALAGLTADASFTEEEKELVVPKQYRVREWVFVH